LVFFTHNRPDLAHKDMEFFEEAKNLKCKVEKIFEKVMNPMFEKDYGCEIVRSTVHGYKITINN
jgi:nicotinamide N-methyltransferase